jgi:acyl-CoA dehydrogenase
MAWDFETDPEYQAQLDWAEEFVRGRGRAASDDLWPSQHIPRRLAAARAKYAEYLEHEVGNQ